MTIARIIRPIEHKWPGYDHARGIRPCATFPERQVLDHDQRDHRPCLGELVYELVEVADGCINASPTSATASRPADRVPNRVALDAWELWAC